ncbi:hypothetical protein [Piscirickettsia salmonis]|uniref:hypothetical protein n=1 Tax=Piscirickettsia salmonis TaxID=1238 RepID=UPI000A799FFA|nr:hypothetical protein [Piscirickettsia salmonis]
MGIVALNQHAVTDAIVFGEQLFTQQLLERPFLHGIFDCYSLIRDFYAVEKKIFLPDFPRQRSWWEIENIIYMSGILPRPVLSKWIKPHHFAAVMCY